MLRMRSASILIVLICSGILTQATRAQDALKPKVAVFPLGGSADAGMRDKVGFSLRTKLDRDGTYEPIDGPSMKDLVASREAPIMFDTKLDDVKTLAQDADATILIWGEFDERTLKLHVYDSRKPTAPPSDLEKKIDDPTDLRFAIEEVLETLPGVKPFEHPTEVSVQHDAASDAAWDANPNLVAHGDFEGPDATTAWNALLRDQKYNPPVSDDMPDVDRVAIVPDPDNAAGGKAGVGHVLAMNLSKDVAESNGLACISSVIPIQPSTRYRLRFRYKSDGPVLHVFVKGYATIDGEEREVYRRQVPPSDATHGQWVTITDDMNPQNGRVAVESLRVDLYAYLKPGTVLFDDVMLKAVGAMTHIAKDDAIKPAPK
jgi:hypothetical protein